MTLSSAALTDQGVFSVLPALSAGAGGAMVGGVGGVAGAAAGVSLAAGVAGASLRLLQPARMALNITAAIAAWRTSILPPGVVEHEWVNPQI